jgi:hypothetical protein
MGFVLSDKDKKEATSKVGNTFLFSFFDFALSLSVGPIILLAAAGFDNVLLKAY